MSMKFLLLCLTSLWALVACQTTSSPEQGTGFSSQQEQVQQQVEEQGQDEEENPSSVSEDELVGTQYLTVESLAGVWENEVGDRWEITADGFIKSEDLTYRFSEDYLIQGESAFSQELLTETGEAVFPNRMGFLFLPVGQPAEQVSDQSDVTRDRFYIANQGGFSWFQEHPEWIFYKVAVSTSTENAEIQSSSSDAVQSEDITETFSQLSAGDLSSLIGTWQNAVGGNLVVTETGFEGMEVTRSGQAEDTFYFTVMMEGAPNAVAGGGGLVYIPAGVSYGSLEDSAGMTDYSDISRDRFIMGHILPPAIDENSTDWVYYRQD